MKCFLKYHCDFPFSKLKKVKEQNQDLVSAKFTIYVAVLANYCLDCFFSLNWQ